MDMLDKKNLPLRFLPLLLIVIVLAVIIYFGWYRYLSFASLKKYHDQLLIWTQQHFFVASLSYILIYIVAVATSVPGAVFLTIAGGFLFGIIFGTIYTVIAATIGATLLFLAVKTAFGTWLTTKAQPWLKKMKQGFNRNAFNYLLSLRLIPLFPFWAVNIVPALLNMRLSSYIAATVLGIIPGTFVYTALGNGLGTFFANNTTPNLAIIFKPGILLPILALAILSLVPIFYKRWKHKNAKHKDSHKGAKKKRRKDRD